MTGDRSAWTGTAEDYARFARGERLAYWINAYNATAIRGGAARVAYLDYDGSLNGPRPR